MGADLNSYSELKDVVNRPIGFVFSTMPTQTASLAVRPAAQMAPSPSLKQGQHPVMVSQASVVERESREATLHYPTRRHEAERVLQTYPISRQSVQVTQAVQVAQDSPAGSIQNSTHSSTHSRITQASRPTRAKLAHKPLTLNIGFLKWGTMSVASALFAAAFAAYGWTVSLEQRGSDLNRRLNQLRDHEKGMVGMTTGLGASLADDARVPSSNLHLPGMDSILSLEAAPSRPPVTITEESVDIQPIRTNQPRGY
ncbi:MAG: hypothetical protein AAF327_07395 [Cyanobacteria bacterium P01_A01_bin.37]